MSQTIILGDPHVGKGTSIGKPGTGFNLNSRVSDQVNLLDWVLEQALNSDTYNIICTGDLFEDPKPHPSLIALAMSWFKKCSDNSVSVHIIAGNHDILRSGQYYSSPLDVIAEAEIDNIFVYKEPATIHLNTTSYTLFPFKDRRSLNADSHDLAIGKLAQIIDYENAEIPNNYNKILIGHLAIKGSIPVGDEISDLSNEIHCPVEIFSKYDSVLMGHVHKYQVLSKTPYVIHTGSMDISDFSESNHDKFIFMIDNETGKIQSKKIPTRKLIEVSVSIPQDTKDTTEYLINKLLLEKNIDNSIMRVEVVLEEQSMQSVNKQKVEKLLYSLGIHHLCKFSESRKFSSVKKNKELSKKLNSSDESASVKLYAETFIEEKFRQDFISQALSVITEFNSENKE